MEFLSLAVFQSFIDYVQLGFKLAEQSNSMTDDEMNFVQTLLTGTLEDTINAAYSLSTYISLHTIVQLKSNFKLTNPSGKLGKLDVSISKNWSKRQRARKHICVVNLNNRPRVDRKLECRLACSDLLSSPLEQDPNEMFALAQAKCDTVVIV